MICNHNHFGFRLDDLEKDERQTQQKISVEFSESYEICEGLVQEASQNKHHQNSPVLAKVRVGFS